MALKKTNQSMKADCRLGWIKPNHRAKLIFNAAALASGEKVSELCRVPTHPPRSCYTVDLTRILIAFLAFHYNCQDEAVKLFKIHWRTLYDWNLKYQRELRDCPDVDNYLTLIISKLGTIETEYRLARKA